MEYFGLAALVFAILSYSYIGKIKKLEKKVKQIEKKNKGDNDMSDIIAQIIGKKCKLEIDSDYSSVNVNDKICTVIEADDEWIKISYEDKKAGTKTVIIKAEALCSAEIVEG